MKKLKLWKSATLLALGLTLTAWAAPIATLQNEAEQVQKITNLSRDSQKMDLGCQSFLSEVRTLSPLSTTKEYFRTRSEAVSVLRKVPQYPGTPLATSDALERLFDFPDLPKGPAAHELWLAIAGLSDCHSVEFFGIMTRLMDHRTQRLLSAAETKNVRKVVYDYLNREAVGGSKFLLQAKNLIRLAVFAQRENILHFPKDAKLSAEDLEWKSWKITNELSMNREVFENVSAVIAGSPDYEAALTETLHQLDQSEDLLADLSLLLTKETTNNPRAPKEVIGPLSLLK